ncbi:hypothetical protein [Amorphus sp. MBR-141]
MQTNRHFVSTQDEHAREYRRYERLLARTLRPFINELQLIDAGVLIGYILLEREKLLEDLIDSSAENFLKPGAIHYGRAACARCEWGSKPTAAIELELRHPQLTAYFSVVFEADFVGINLHGILYSGAPGEDEENWLRFAAVVAECSLAETGASRIDGSAPSDPSDHATH